MGYLRFQPHNAHMVRVEERNLLFHIPTTSLFELDALDGEVLGYFAERGDVAEADMRDRFKGQDPSQLAEKVQGLLDLDILTDGSLFSHSGSVGV